MDSDFIEQLQWIKLTTEEGEIIKVRSSQRENIIEECLLSLFGRFLTKKPVNWRAAKTLLCNTWKFCSNLSIIDVGEDLVQFKFTMESQVQWVLNNEPWSFDNSLLLLRHWERGIMANKVTFTHCPLWLQVWGLPFDLFNEEVGQEIGRGLGRVVEVD
nr:hypothetical protein CFP56_63133 [Quercus suber]